MSDSNKYIYGKNSPSVFISPRGDDKNPGTFELPLNTLKKAVEICRAKNIKDIVAFEGEYMSSASRLSLTKMTPV